MIRRRQKKDINEVADIWLCVNLEAHGFIPDRYWRDHFEAVKEMLGQAEVYIFEDGDGVSGFIGLDDDYLAGIFVRNGMRSSGIGKQLLDHVKGIRHELYLHVYQKNERAVQFYRREKFVVQSEGVDEGTGEKEYTMMWRKDHE